MKRVILVCCLFIQFSGLHAQWKFENGSVAFSIKNAGLTVNGSFSRMKATIAFDRNQLGSVAMEASVESATIETGISLRNKHLKKSEYFDVEKFPLIQMKLKRLEKDLQNWKGTFLLTIKGISKEVVVPIVFSETEKTANMKGTFSVDRREYKVGGSSWTMGDDVKIVITANLSHLKP